jgi:predicted oxidoreductase (fatty acid repression mutant protein)
LIERIEDGDYESREIPEGFDVTPIVNRNKIPERKIRSMVDNSLKLSPKNTRSRPKRTSLILVNKTQQFNDNLETEAREIIKTEPNDNQEQCIEHIIENGHEDIKQKFNLSQKNKNDVPKLPLQTDNIIFEQL